MKNIHYEGSPIESDTEVSNVRVVEDQSITMPANAESQPMEAQQVLDRLQDRCTAWAEEKDKIKAELDDKVRQGNRLADGAKKMKRRFGMES